MRKDDLNLDCLSDKTTQAEAPDKKILAIIDKDKQSLQSKLVLPFTIIFVLLASIHIVVLAQYSFIVAPQLEQIKRF